MADCMPDTIAVIGEKRADTKVLSASRTVLLAAAAMLIAAIAPMKNQKKFPVGSV